jgi:aspartate aminotransferase/aminotransferase
MRSFDSSGIRRVFDLARSLRDPINLSIGQPDFEVPLPVQQAAIEAIGNHKNAYSPTQGIAELREVLQERIDAQYPGQDRKVFVTSGTSGGLTLATMTLMNPDDEVIIFDPYFVMYQPLVSMLGGRPVYVDTHPQFRIDINRVEAALTPRTKLVLFNSPANPTGVVASQQEVRELAELCARRGIALVSDEIYNTFCFDGPYHSPAQYNPQTIVIEGFSKTHAMTGWRVGYMHGPAAVIDEMIKLQQYTFVCAPQPFQWAAIKALDVDMSAHLSEYRHKRDFVYEGLKEHFRVEKPGGAFYIYPRAPWGTATEFVEEAIRNEVLIIPGKIFSRQDTHFRISYAADQRTLERGVEVLCRLSQRRG